MAERARRVDALARTTHSGHRTLDLVLATIDRDDEVGGGIIAGAFAYRLFVWLLPFALVLVAGVGIAAEAGSRSPQDAARSLGLAGLVSSSVASASKSSARWYAIAVGVPVLLLATRSLLRVLIGAHRLVWADLRAAAPRPTPRATARFLVLLLGFFVLSGLAGAARAASPVGGVLASLALMGAYAGLWLLVSLQLPHRSAGPRELVPGALLTAAGLELIHLAAAYAIAPMALAKQGTYGALGTAAALLLGLYLIGRVIVVAAALDATLWGRSAQPSGQGPPAPKATPAQKRVAR